MSSSPVAQWELEQENAEVKFNLDLFSQASKTASGALSKREFDFECGPRDDMLVDISPGELVVETCERDSMNGEDEEDSSGDEELADVVSELTIESDDVSVDSIDAHEVISETAQVMKSIVAGEKPLARMLLRMTRSIQSDAVLKLMACCFASIVDNQSSVGIYVGIKVVPAQYHTAVVLWYYCDNEDLAVQVKEGAQSYISLLMSTSSFHTYKLVVEHYVSVWRETESDPLTRMKDYNEGSILISYDGREIELGY